VGEFERVVEANAEHVCHVNTRADLDDARLRLVLAMEGAEPLEGDAAAFDEWYERGVRSASLTWNQREPIRGRNRYAGTRADRQRTSARPPVRGARRHPRPRTCLRADVARCPRRGNSLLSDACGLPRTP
jgi:hypothetical protein